MIKTNKTKKEKKKRGIFLKIGIGGEKRYLIENLSMLLASGMDVLSSLESIKIEAKSRRMKKIVENLKEDINAGSPVWQALNDTGVMPAYAISLARIGEQTGRLPENLRIIADQQQKDRNFRSKLSSAMLYPLIVLSLTVVIGTAVAWFILPRLSSVFDQLKLELPFITKALIAVGNFLGQHGLLVVPGVFFFLIILIYFAFFFSKTKFIGQTLFFFLPGTKKMIREVELSRTGYLLGSLLQSGVPIVDSISSLADATTFRNYKKFYLFIKNNIADGSSLRQSFDAYKKSSRLVPTPVQHMIVAGEQSGRLPETLTKIGEIFEEKTENTAKNLTVLLEPILLFIVWIGVVSVALAVILPIYSLIGGFNEGSNSPPPPPPKEKSTEAVSDKTNQPEQALKETEENSQPSDDEQNEEQKEGGKKMLKILPTGLNYLNVRDDASLQGEIIDKVTPGDQYEYTETKNGWYKIILDGEETGWVVGDYVEEVSADKKEEEQVENQELQLEN